jgi:PPOX class probable FMN-dependent enzyme
MASVIPDAAALRDHYRDPHPLVLKKVVPEVDEAAATFLAASPFFVLATASAEGADASPRGGPPGFVRVLDRGRIAWADLAGNNRLDSFQNVVQQADVGLLFFSPGVEETLRVNGRAELSTDPAVLAAVAFDEVHPKVAVVVHVTECYVHCAKALRRAALWDPASRPAPEARPSAAAIITRHLELDVDPSVVEADLEAGYRRTLWVEGGDV